MIAQPGTAVRVSPGYIHTCLGHANDTDPQVICSYGVDLFAALTLVLQQGFATLDSAAYPCPPGVCGVIQPTGRISEFGPIAGAGMAKAAIQNAGPIAADMYIWEDFFDYTTARAPTYQPDATRQGPYPHSVCVIGFNDQGWIVKNSMGNSWGDGRGCAVIAYGSCALLGAPPPPGGVPRQAFAVSL